MSEIIDLIAKISKLSHPNQISKNFPAYIRKIRFPFFRNLQLGSEIEFNFPLTVFVGQNGCGKSSALQALYGCPDGHSTGEYWFNTATDPIPEQKAGLNPSYWYEYYHPEAKQIVQILKYRTSYNKSIGPDKEKRVNPDYWEPARPGAKYGMITLKELPKDKLTPGRSSTRWEVLKKEVKYLDFRGILSAFDKYFYFGEAPKNQTRIKTKQDYLRSHSGRLHKVFEGNVKVFYRDPEEKKKPINSPCKDLSKYEISEISKILGKKYETTKIVKHSFYKQDGVSVRFSIKHANNKHTYTEAFAGSGEMSIVTLVHEVYSAAPNSLILLDEPEVSLHPGAQKRMLKFLLHQIHEFKHQVIICTHSPALIEGLPPNAIKLFTPDPEGNFKIYPEISPQLAFLRIGQTISSKKRIIVEDEAAKQLLEKVLSIGEHPKSELYEVDFHPGGAKDIFKEALAFSRVGSSDYYFFLDGDQRPESNIDPEHIGDADLDITIKQYTNIDVKEFQFVADGGRDTQAQLNAEKRKFIKFLLSNFKFLPGKDPEDSILVASAYDGKPGWDSDSQVDAKETIRIWVHSEIDNPTASDVSTYRKKLLNKLNMEHPYIKQILKQVP